MAMYYVRRNGDGKAAQDWNLEVWSEQPEGALTPEEHAVRFPQDESAPKAPEEMVEVFMARVQGRLDSFAKTRTYDSILSAASYAASTNPTYAAEGQYAVEVRDATWAFANVYLAEVLAGKRAVPTWEDFEATLDAAVPLVWPVEDIRVTADQPHGG